MCRRSPVQICSTSSLSIGSWPTIITVRSLRAAQARAVAAGYDCVVLGDRLLDGPRDGFTLVFVGGCALALGLLARFGAPLLRRGVLVFLAAFSCCYALYDIRDDLLHLQSSTGKSDADALAGATFIPAIVWGVGWGLLSILLGREMYSFFGQ